MPPSRMFMHRRPSVQTPAHAANRYFGIIACKAGGPGYEDANPASRPRGRASRTLAVSGHQARCRSRCVVG